MMLATIVWYAESVPVSVLPKSDLPKSLRFVNRGDRQRQFRMESSVISDEY